MLPTGKISCRSRCRQATSHAVGWFVLLAGLTSLGCEQPPPAMPSPGLYNSASTPEKSFQQIAKAIRVELEGLERTGPAGPGGFVSNRGTYSRIKYEFDVQDEVFPPKANNGTYHGRLTVVTESTFTFRPSMEAGTEDEKEKKSEETQANPNEQQGEFFGNFDSLGDTVGENADAAIPDSPLRSALFTERADEDVRTYDFAYENGQWVLKSNLDNERLMKLVFDFVLKRQ